MPIRKQLFNAPFIISLGSGAGKILSNIPLSDKYYKIAVNSSSKDLEMIESKVDAILSCGGNGSGMSPEQGSKDMKASLKKLKHLLGEVLEETKTTSVDVIPVIISLGHGFGSGSSYLALDALKEEYKDSLIIPFVVTPFTWEGEGVIKRAYESLKDLTELTTCVIISNEEVGNLYKHIGSSYDRINIMLGEVISDFLQAMSATDGIIQTVDKSDLRKMLSGELATMRYAKLRNANEVTVRMIKEDMEKRFLKVEFKHFKPAPPKLHVFYCIDGKGPLNPKNLGEIQEYIASREYVNQDELKPLLIERKRGKGCNFLWLESGYKLACDKNIYGVY